MTEESSKQYKIYIQISFIKKYFTVKKIFYCVYTDMKS